MKALLLVEKRGTQRIYQVDVLDGDMLVVPFYWVLVKNINNALLFMPSIRCAAIKNARIVGFSKARDLGVSRFNPLFITLMLVGFMTLSFPVRLKINFGVEKSMDLTDMKKVLLEAVSANPDFYTRAGSADVERQLNRARDFYQIRRAFN